MRSDKIHNSFAKLLIAFAFLFFSFTTFSQSYKQLCTTYNTYREQGNSEKTVETANLLVKNYVKELLKEPLLYAEIENSFGNYYFNHNNFDSSIYCYSRAVNKVYSVKADTSFDYGFYLYNLAYVSGKVGYYEKAEQYYLVSLPILAKFLNASSEEYTLFYKEYVEMKIDMGDYVAATPLNDALLYYFKTLKGENNTYYLACINNKARIAQGQGDYNAAAQLFLQALYTNQQYHATDTSNIATMANNVAECYRLMGDYDAAEPLYLEAYNLKSKYSKATKDDLASLLNNMGLLYKAKSNYSQAETCFLKSIEYYKAANYQNNTEFSNPLNGLGDLYRLMGNYKAAVSNIEQSVMIRKNTSGETHEYYANALSNLALLQMQFDYLDEAESVLLQCEIIYKNKLGEDNQRYANCLNNLATLYARKKLYSKALEYNEKCLHLMEKSGAKQTDKYAQYLNGKGSIQCEIRNYKAAIETFTEASAIFKANFGTQNFNYIDMQFNLANVNERAKNDSGAVRYYLRAMSGYKKIMEDNFVSMSEEEKTDFYYILSNRFETFYSFVIDLSKRSTLKNDTLLKTLLNVRLLDKSLLLSESRSTNKAIMASSDTTVQRVFTDWLQQKKYLQELYKYSLSELAQNNVDLEQEETIKNTLEKKLNSSSAIFRKANTAVNAFAGIKNSLTKKDLAIDIIRTAIFNDDGTAQINYAALLVGKEYTAPKLITLDSCAFFDTLFIDHYKHNIEDTLTDRLSYNRFYKAFEKYTAGISNIYFSADGVYQKLNLYTLYNPVTQKYLLENAEISQLNSLKDLLNTKEPANTNHTAALFGFPDYELKATIQNNANANTIATRAVFTDLPELPGTKKETEDIAALLTSKNWKANLLLAQYATEEEIKKLESPAILHIATHGFFLPDEDTGDEKTLGFSTEQARQNPLLRSGLLMAGASAPKNNALLKQDDGILTAYEASLLNLQNTDLVTLSACETGLGELVNGQGVYGLQRAFLTAGAKSIVMSLWVVDDNATQELMTGFYQNYLQNDPANTKRKSLRKAQLALKKQYPHPYYWGAFVLIGN
ncbi:MAG: CHAT domain-containing protein [Bacteroidota bacterium]